MTDNNTHSILFELQKNLEDLSSAKAQMDEFRSSSSKVVKGIDTLKTKYSEYLEELHLDYKNRVSALKLELKLFSSNIKDENTKSIDSIITQSEKRIDHGIEAFKLISNKAEIANKEQVEKFSQNINNLTDELQIFSSKMKEENTNFINTTITKSQEKIEKGVEKFESVSNKVESSHNKQIENITTLLAKYKNVVEASNSLIDTLNAIDFPSKLDALSTKTQLIIEAITNSKQALEIKFSENQNVLLEKINSGNKQTIQSIENETNSLKAKNTELSENLSLKIKDMIDKKINQTNECLHKQEKSIKFIKIFLFVALFLIIADLVVNILNFVSK